MPKKSFRKRPTQVNLLDVFERNKYNLPEAARQSKAWFEQQVNMLWRQGMTPYSVYKGNPDQITTRLLPGFMYMFFYDPKTKQDLPYYDKFPLVLLYKRTQDGFMGINFHYLPYRLRVLLLHRLMIYKTNNKMDESTRIKYTWEMIDGVSKFAAAKPAFKQYLFANMRSSFRQIYANDWATAMLLPVEFFVKAAPDQVWIDSRKKIGYST